ncbi:MAG: MucBP domain-containing protein [Lachnospiraceae bacterium]|nr:MucBP domain-containing protein [Lachnospiraceae bacterium]
MTYKVKITNSGNVDLWNLSAMDTMDRKLTLKRDTIQGTSIASCKVYNKTATEGELLYFTWNGQMKVGQSVTLSYKATVTGYDGKTLHNMVKAGAFDSDPNARKLKAASRRSTVGGTGETEGPVVNPPETPITPGEGEGNERPTGPGGSVTGSSGTETKPKAPTVTWLDKDGKTFDTDTVKEDGSYREPNGTPEPPEGHRFKEWDTPEKNSQTGNITIKPVFEKVDITITVKYVDEDGKELKDSETVVKKYGETYDVNDKISEELTVGEDHYIKDSVNGNVMDTAVKNEEVTVTYTLDNMADPDRDTDDDPSNGDGVPDKYQAAVKYESGEGGNVSGVTSKVITLTDDEGTYVESKEMVIGTDGVTATPDEGCTFKEWTPDPDKEQTIEGGKTYTYTA